MSFSHQQAVIDGGNVILVAFKRKPIQVLQPIRQQTLKEQPPPPELAGALQALAQADWPAVQAIFLDRDTSPRTRFEIRQQMLAQGAGLDSLQANKGFHVALLCGDGRVPDGDFQAAFGETKTDAVADALLKQSYKPSAGSQAAQDSGSARDPALLGFLSKQIPLDVWNDKQGGAPKRGLAPRVCAALWTQGGYTDICDLIRLGVDTTISTSTKGNPPGSHSGFIMPIQHTIQDSLPDIPKLGTQEAHGWDDKRQAKAQGARDIFATLADTETAVTVTTWKAVKDSDMLVQFNENPGTIWGFEHVRQPFVTAAHETEHGGQPLRMLELWAAVEKALTPDKFQELLADPKATIKSVVKAASKKAADQIDTEAVYADIRDKREEFLKKFERDATTFLTEFAAQVPKGTYTAAALDLQGQHRQGKVGDRDDLGLSDVAGIHWEKLMTSIACKAGLWWAKNEKKPVYYCLDGIKMQEVADYKIVKNKAIQTFLDKGDVLDSTDSHKEIITFQEIREILKNWDDLRDTVKFVDKGTVYTPEEAEAFVVRWSKEMDRAKKAAGGRAPAPKRTAFAMQLSDIDPGLMKRLDDRANYLGDNDTETDKDARDIVRKAGYLVKFSNTRPDYALKYLMSKCEVLEIYEVLPAGLGIAAAKFAALANDNATKAEMSEAGTALVAQIKLCPPKFQRPLGDAMLRHPMIRRDKALKSALK